MKKVIKQDDILTLDIVDYGINGEGIAKYKGVVIFIPFAMKGERIEAKITYVKRDFATAKLLKIIEQSSLRKDYPCNRFIKCGGCNLLHVDYGEQLALKRNTLENTLKKSLGEVKVEPCVPSPNTLGYRNKVQLPFGIVNGRAVLGFFRAGTHKIVSITKCFLHGDWLEELIEVVLDFVRKNDISVYDETSHTGLLRHMVARFIDNKLCLVLVTNGDTLPHYRKLIDRLKEKFKDFSLYLSVNQKKTNVILGDKLICLKEGDFQIDILGIKVKLSPLSFLQVNDKVRDMIYKRVIDECRGSDAVIDAYSGVGILGAALVKHGIKEVYNIEIVPEAVKDANALAKENGVSDRIKNILGDVSKELPKLIEKIHSQDKRISIILDPPRKGVDKNAISALTNIPYPINLIYISCNPATLARDLALLTKNDIYAIKSITPCDMFPQTRHVECVVLMSRAKD